jgi:hypothetical protein
MKNNNKVWAWVLTVVVIITVGVVLWQNPFGVRGTKITEYGNVIAEDFPADFPGDSGIVEIIKNQKNQSLVGGTEFVLAYYTTTLPADSVQAVSAYALTKNLPNIYDGSGINDGGSEYSYFMAENDAKTESISVNASEVPDTEGILSLVEVSIKK